MTKKSPTEHPARTPHAKPRPRGRQPVTLAQGDLPLTHPDEACERRRFRRLRLVQTTELPASRDGHGHGHGDGHGQGHDHGHDRGHGHGGECGGAA